MLPRFPYPAVLKPVDGGGGLGVYWVDGPAEAGRALARVMGLRNYDGAAFPAALIEEFVPGTENSVPGVAAASGTLVLSACEKVIGLEADPGRTGLTRFRELAHVACPGARPTSGPSPPSESPASATRPDRSTST